MNTKYTVAYGDRQTESILTFVSKQNLLYDVLKDCGYNVTSWSIRKMLTYAEIDGDMLPTGRYFTLLKSESTNEEESDEVVFF